MKRKIIKLGTATLVTSLPSKWIKQFGLKQGDYLDVEENNSTLTFSVEKERTPQKIEIELTGLTAKNIHEYILAVYKQGADEIKFIFNNPQINDLNGKKVKTVFLLQQFIDQLIGIEIIDQKDNYIVIRDFSKSGNAGIDEDYDQVIKRIFSLVSSIGEDSLKNIESFNKEALEAIRYRHNNIKKFTGYATRLLSKNPQTAEIVLKSKIVEELEEVSDIYSWIPMEIAENKTPLSKNAIKLYSKTNDCFSALFDLYCISNNENLIKVDELRKESFSIINDTMKKASKQEAVLYCRLTTVLNLILNTYQFILGLNLKRK